MASFPVRDKRELQTILAKVDQINPLISMMLEFEARSGLRNCDVRALKFSDVMINGIIKDSFDVVQQKSLRMRMNRPKNPMSEKAAKQASKITIHVNGEMKELIQQIYDHNSKHALMFQSNHHLAKNGNAISIRYVNDVLKRVAADLKLPYQLSTHSMRKTFAMMMLDGGASMKHLKEALGHSSIAVTDHYIRTFDDETKQFTTGISIPTIGEIEDDE
tara:strand:+ start:8531 stop:9184 length:654 start_codon:yes stop_codon:yes gene_type:complete